jgi:rhomboid protease GluP
MNDDELIPVVKETHLSQKPSEESGFVAAMSLAVIVGASLIYWFDIAGLASKLPANGERVFRHNEYWRLFTTIFVHADLRHLLSNAVGVGALSYLLYGYFGSIVYPWISLGSGVVITLVALTTYPPHVYLLGASGVIYFMAAFWLTLYLFLERRYSTGKRFLRATGFALIVLVPTSFNPETSYRTHGLGFIVGVIFAIIYFIVYRDGFRSAEIIEWE